ncbi:MAG: phytanoyl-CoA dioxygenase family protein [Calditrichia bacterium]|nr:phytanoyl-CoA dioxygenase family protein [Calditrichota bacterium]
MSEISTHWELNEPFPVSEKQIEFFRNNGFIKIRDVLSPLDLDTYGKEITKKVFELNDIHEKPMAERDTYQKAFLQVTNLWQHSEIVKSFVFSKRLASIATELLGTCGVRLYHDQALYKEPGGGFTPWHADQYYWPLATEKCCTVWIPLQRTSLDMGPLAFSAKSHHFSGGRNFKISDESEREIAEALKKQQFEYVQESFDPGEISFHYGWTFHRAGPNTTPNPRKVMTIIYMDIDMQLKAPENENQALDRDVFCPGAQLGETIQTALNPILYQRDSHQER